MGGGLRKVKKSVTYYVNGPVCHLNLLTLTHYTRASVIVEVVTVVVVVVFAAVVFTPSLGSVNGSVTF